MRISHFLFLRQGQAQVSQTEKQINKVIKWVFRSQLPYNKCLAEQCTIVPVIYF